MPDTPVGWTRQSNVDGLLRGTYDVISFWRRGPELEPMSDVPVYINNVVDSKTIGWTKLSNYNKYCSGEDSVIACWPNKPDDSSVELYIKNQGN